MNNFHLTIKGEFFSKLVSERHFLLSKKQINLINSLQSWMDTVDYINSFGKLVYTSCMSTTSVKYCFFLVVVLHYWVTKTISIHHIQLILSSNTIKKSSKTNLFCSILWYCLKYLASKQLLFILWMINIII